VWVFVCVCVVFVCVCGVCVCVCVCLCGFCVCLWCVCVVCVCVCVCGVCVCVCLCVCTRYKGNFTSTDISYILPTYLSNQLRNYIKAIERYPIDRLLPPLPRATPPIHSNFRIPLSQVLTIFFT